MIRARFVCESSDLPGTSADLGSVPWTSAGLPHGPVVSWWVGREAWTASIGFMRLVHGSVAGSLDTKQKEAMCVKDRTLDAALILVMRK